MSNRLTGKQVPEFLRKRGIRWIMPAGVRLKFEQEQTLREEGYRAGYLQGLMDGKRLKPGGVISTGYTNYTREYRNALWDRHCKQLGFTPAELDSLPVPKHEDLFRLKLGSTQTETDSIKKHFGIDDESLRNRPKSRTCPRCGKSISRSAGCHADVCSARKRDFRRR